MDIGNANPQAGAALLSSYQASIGGRIVSFIRIDTVYDMSDPVARTVAEYVSETGVKHVRWTAVVQENGDSDEPYVLVAARVSTQDELDELEEWITTQVPDVKGKPTVTKVSAAHSNQIHLDPYNGWP